jgi:hypothetical protein
VQPGEVLSKTADEAEVIVRPSVARTHPLGPRVEPFLLGWPGWGDTLRRFSAHPLTELDWIDIVGPKDAAKQRMATRTAVDDATIDARLGGPGDGSLRVVSRPEPHLVTVVPPDANAKLQAALAGAHVVDPPADPDEGARALLAHPHALLSALPVAAESGLLRVWSRPDGAAEAELDLDCKDAARATLAASEVRDEVDRVNGMLVNMITHGLLSGLSIQVDGAHVKLKLPASREQLEAVAGLASAMLPPPSRP